MYTHHQENSKRVKSALHESQNSTEKKSIFPPKKGIAYHLKKIKLLPKFLTKKESFFIKVLISVIIFAASALGVHRYFQYSQVVPKPGGEYIEGIVGEPRLVNPILAQANEVDRDLAKLLFSGLMRHERSKLSPDLASSFQISEDQLTYTFTLREDVKWHDGSPFNAQDVVFTIKSIQNQDFKSPLYSSFAGLKVSSPDEKIVIFTLNEPFAPFPSLLTFGILPKHIWEDIPPNATHLADFNIKRPIGTGPFKIKRFKYDNRGVVKSYTLERNDDFYRQKSFLETITFKFYPDILSTIDALNNKNIDGINFVPNKYFQNITNKNVAIKALSLPQYSAIFYNHRKNKALAEVGIRKALTQSINRKKIIKQVLDDQGEVIYGPILPGFLGYDPNIKRYEFNPKEAITLIETSKWEKITPDEYKQIIKQRRAEEEAAAAAAEAEATDQENKENIITNDQATNTLPEEDAEHEEDKDEEITVSQEFFWKKDDSILTVVLTTVDNPETVEVAQKIQSSWQEIGVHVIVSVVSKDTLLPDIIQPRNYEALLFGHIIGNDPDPYAFWHSSQTEHPGVNLALYSNKEGDAFLEDARKTSDPNERAKKYIEFQRLLKEDLPATFLYNPTYPYVIHKKIKGFDITRIANPADRFNTIEKWYTNTKRTFK